MPTVLEVTSDTFDAEVRDAQHPVLVEFWKDSCPPCERAALWLDAFAEELGDKVKIVKIKIEDNSRTVDSFAIRGAPHFLVFRDGAVVARQPGLPDRSRLLAWVKSAISEVPANAKEHEWIRFEIEPAGT